MSYVHKYPASSHLATAEIKTKRAIRERIRYHKGSSKCLHTAVRRAIQRGLRTAQFENSPSVSGVGKTDYLLPQIQNLIPQKRGRKKSSDLKILKSAEFESPAAQHLADFCPIISDSKKCLSNFKIEQEPTPEQIKAEVKKLKEQGIFKETDLTFFSSNVIPFPVKTAEHEINISWSAPAQIILTGSYPSDFSLETHLEPAQTPLESPEVNKTALALQIVASLAIAGSATAILVLSSAEVFGDGWQAYLKAALLEIAIICFSLSKPKNEFVKIGHKIIAIAMIALSVFVLHAGVQKNEDDSLAKLSSGSADIELLKKQHASAINAHDQLDPTWDKKRKVWMDEAESIRLKIKEAETAVQSSGAASTIQKIHLSESAIRAVLLLLNLFFSHHLLSLIRKCEP